MPTLTITLSLPAGCLPCCCGDQPLDKLMSDIALIGGAALDPYEVWTSSTRPTIPEYTEECWVPYLEAHMWTGVVADGLKIAFEDIDNNDLGGTWDSGKLIFGIGSPTDDGWKTDPEYIPADGGKIPIPSGTHHIVITAYTGSTTVGGTTYLTSSFWTIIKLKWESVFQDPEEANRWFSEAGTSYNYPLVF